MKYLPWIIGAVAVGGVGYFAYKAMSKKKSGNAEMSLPQATPASVSSSGGGNWYDGFFNALGDSFGRQVGGWADQLVGPSDPYFA